MDQYVHNGIKFILINLNCWLFLQVPKRSPLDYNDSIFLFFEYSVQITLTRHFSLIVDHIVDKSFHFGHENHFGLIFGKAIIF